MHKIILSSFLVGFSCCNYNYSQQHTLKAGSNLNLTVKIDNTRINNNSLLTDQCTINQNVLYNTTSIFNKGRNYGEGTLYLPEASQYKIYNSSASILALHMGKKKLALYPITPEKQERRSKCHINLSNEKYKEICIRGAYTLYLNPIKNVNNNPSNTSSCPYVAHMVLGGSSEEEGMAKFFLYSINKINIGSLAIASTAFPAKKAKFSIKKCYIENSITLGGSHTPYSLRLNEIANTNPTKELLIEYSHKKDPNSLFYILPVELVHIICRYARKLLIEIDRSARGSFKYSLGPTKASVPLLKSRIIFFDFPTQKTSYLIIKYKPRAHHKSKRVNSNLQTTLPHFNQPLIRLRTIQLFTKNN